MPATAGRVRMPANNRVHSSAALQTHGIWQSAIGYDPYAPNKDEKKNKSSQKTSVAEPEQEPENAYASFQGLLALARITSSSVDDVRGACKKCGRVGHLTFQCRNFLSVKEDGEGKDPDLVHASVLSGLEKLKGNKHVVESEDSSEEDESESSDSDYDSEIERAIAEKYGKRVNGSSKARISKQNESRDKTSRDKKHEGRSKRRNAKEYSDSEDDDKKTRRKDDDKEKRRDKKRKEKSKRRSRYVSKDESSDTSTQLRNERKKRRAYSSSDSDFSDRSRDGKGKNRSKKSRKYRRKDD